MADRSVYAIYARQFADRAETVEARERVWAYMRERIEDTRRADPPPLTIGVGLDADSAAGFLVFIAPREFGPETELMVALAGGVELPLGEVPDEFLEGLLARRAEMSRRGELTRFDSRRPAHLRADGTLEEW